MFTTSSNHILVRQENRCDNVVAFRCETLIDKMEELAGRFSKCTKCGAYISVHCATLKDDCWECAFCQTKNSRKYDAEKPDSDVANYVLEGNYNSSTISIDDKNLIYCIDTSSSMAHQPKVSD